MNAPAGGNSHRERKCASDTEDVDQERFAGLIKQPVQSVREYSDDFSRRKAVAIEAFAGFRLNDSSPAQGRDDLQEGMPSPPHAKVQCMHALQKAKSILVKLRHQRMPGGFQRGVALRDVSLQTAHGGTYGLRLPDLQIQFHPMSATEQKWNFCRSKSERISECVSS